MVAFGAWSRLAFSGGTCACAVFPCAGGAVPPGRSRTPHSQELLRSVENRRRDQLLRGLRHASLPGAAHEHDLVLRRVEPDVGAGDVVVDDEVDVLLVEHRPLSLEARLAVFGAEGDEHLAWSLPLAERARHVD